MSDDKKEAPLEIALANARVPQETPLLRTKDMLTAFGGSAPASSPKARSVPVAKLNPENSSDSVPKTSVAPDRASPSQSKVPTETQRKTS